MASKEQQQQLEIINGIVQAKSRIEAIREENRQLKEKILARVAINSRLQKLSLAAASLIAAAPSDPTSLKCLAMVDRSAAVAQEKGDEEESNLQNVAGKFLNQMLSVVADFAQQEKESFTIFSMLELEKKLAQMFQFAEDNDIIPKTDDGEGWKGQKAAHDEIANQIQAILDGADNDNE